MILWFWLHLKVVSEEANCVSDRKYTTVGDGGYLNIIVGKMSFDGSNSKFRQGFSNKGLSVLSKHTKV